eukprot:gene15453-17037_t
MARSKSNLFVFVATAFAFLFLFPCFQTTFRDEEEAYKDELDDDERYARFNVDHDPVHRLKSVDLTEPDEEHFLNNNEGDDGEEEPDGDNSQPFMSPKKTSNLCLSPECILASAKVLSTMNHDVDPCNDFYGHVCGKFSERHEPLPDMVRTMSFESKRRSNSFIMRKILEKIANGKKLEYINNLKAAFDSCMNEQLSDNSGVTSIQAILSRYGPWPLDGTKWNKNHWNFKKSLNKLLLNVPVTAFFALTVDLDFKNPNYYALRVSQSGLYLPKDYYLSQKPKETRVRDVYFEMMLQVMKIFGYSSKNLASSMTKVLQFEKKLAKIYLPRTAFRNPEKVQKKMTIKQLEKLNSEINWNNIIQPWMNSSKAKSSSPKKIVVAGEEYFRKLDKLIKKTNKEVLANYMMWRVLLTLKRFAGSKIKAVDLKFSKVYYGTKVSSPHWLTCVNTIQKWMPFAYGRLFVDSEFKSKYAKPEVSRMIHEIRHAFINNLKNVDWMNEKTKQRAKEKALAMLRLVAYPNFMMDDKKLEKKYAGLTLKKEDYIGNFFQVSQFLTNQSIKRLHSKRDRGEWTSSPATVNAFYSANQNRIVFPAGILGPYFYHHQYPASFKYGGIGTIIGHELTHAFDDYGRKFNKDGRLVQWWDKSVIKQYQHVADCIIKQYSHFAIFGRHMNGNLSCGENMADNGGVKLAYLAFKAYAKEHPNELKLPGLQHLTSDQLFFVAFAKIWCVIEPKASIIGRIFTDPHSFPIFRVQGTLSNSYEFAKAFNCKVGSPMNPKKKCKLW